MGFKRLCVSGLSLRRLVFIPLVLFLLTTSQVSVVHAQVAADQLCGAAGLGGGCIGAFEPSSGGAVPGAGGFSPEGLLGGVLTSVVAGLVVDMLVNQATHAASKRTGSYGYSNPASSPQLSTNVNEYVNQQRRFLDERQKQLLSQIMDAPASKLADSTEGMQILEMQAYQAGTIFDGTDPSARWVSNYDAWFSTRGYGHSDPGSSSVTQPLPVNDQSLNYSDNNFQRIQCINTLGSQLCSFPPGNPPLVKLDLANLSRQSISPPTSISPSSPTPPNQIAGNELCHAAGADSGCIAPVKPHAMAPGGVPPPTDPNIVDLRGIGTTVVPLLGMGAPDSPMSSRRADLEKDEQTDPCMEGPVVETKEGLMAAARRVLRAPVKTAHTAVQDRINELTTNPDEDVELITSWTLKTGALPEPQGIIFTAGSKWLRTAVPLVTCHTLQYVTDAVNVVSSNSRVISSDEITDHFQHKRADDVMDAIPTWGKTIRLAVRGEPAAAREEARKVFKDRLKDIVKGTVEDAASDYAKEKAKAFLDRKMGDVPSKSPWEANLGRPWLQDQNPEWNPSWLRTLGK